MAGQPPFFKINGIYTNLYPVPLTSLENFELPQDIAPINYLVNEQINFELDTANLPAPPEVIMKTQFIWDFGDGQTGAGLSQNHIYKKPGSYFVIVKADDHSTPQPQLLQSTLINIVPSVNYKLPKAEIRVNGKAIRDPLTDILSFNFNHTIAFDGTRSESPNAKIISYTWDFGDTQSSDKAKVIHKYLSDQNQVFPVLRIKDSNGFISDTYLEVKNDQNAIQYQIPTDFEKSKQNDFILKIPYILIAGLLVLAISYFYYHQKKRKSNH